MATFVTLRFCRKTIIQVYYAARDYHDGIFFTLFKRQALQVKPYYLSNPRKFVHRPYYIIVDDDREERWCASTDLTF